MLGLRSTCFGLLYLCHMCHSRCAQGNPRCLTRTRALACSTAAVLLRMLHFCLRLVSCILSSRWQQSTAVIPKVNQSDNIKDAPLTTPAMTSAGTLLHFPWFHLNSEWMNECFKLSINFKCVTMKFSQKTLWKSVSISCFCSCEDDLKGKCTCWSLRSLPCLSLLYTRLSRCILLDMVATQICIWCNTFISLKAIQKRHRI